MKNSDIFTLYFIGMAELSLACLGFAVVGLMNMQMLMLLTGSIIDADAVLLFIWQILMLMALWPGQTFWTIRKTTPGGIEHSVIGVPSDDDLRAMNHCAARRAAQQSRG